MTSNEPIRMSESGLYTLQEAFDILMESANPRLRATKTEVPPAARMMAIVSLQEQLKTSSDFFIHIKSPDDEPNDYCNIPALLQDEKLVEYLFGPDPTFATVTCYRGADAAYFVHGVLTRTGQLAEKRGDEATQKFALAARKKVMSITHD